MKNKSFALLSIVAIAFLAGCSPQDGNKTVADLKKETAEQKESVSQPKTESDETIDYLQLVERNGQFYKVNSEIPFSGHAFATPTNGQKLSEGTYKNGLCDGIWPSWDEDGKKDLERTFKDGELINEEILDQQLLLDILPSLTRRVTRDYL